METNDIKTAVLELLKTEGVSCSVTPAGENLDRDGWQCDRWRVAFTKNGKPESFDYFTGLGHRKASQVGLSRPEAKFPRNTVGYADWEKRYLKPAPPDIAGVLYSLILDSRAVDTCFIDWANDYGYDPYSIKALNTYNACCENTKRLRRIFSSSTLAALSEMLRDY